MGIQKYFQQPAVLFFTIVFISFLVRLVGINQMGRTWDEYAYVGVGDTFVHLLAKGDFGNEQWYAFPDHPPLSRYLYGLSGQLSVVERDEVGAATFSYDWTAPRVLSAFLGAASSGFVFLVGMQLFKKKTTAVIGASIFALLPLGIGYTQLITLESLNLLLCTAVVWSFLRYLDAPTLKRAVLVGVLLGLTLATKYTNVVFVVLLLAIWVGEAVQKWRRTHTFVLPPQSAYCIPFVAAATVYILWPALWLHPQQTVANILNWAAARTTPPEEFYFGVYQKVPWHYYLGQLAVTTPPVVLGLFVSACYLIWMKGQRRQAVILTLWLLTPLLLSFYPLKQNGIRYVIMLYAPLALFAGYAADQARMWLRTQQRDFEWYWLGGLLVVLLLPLYTTFPYYLDYYNVFTGGAVRVYEHKLFELGFWGQGQREALIELANYVRPGSTVGMAVVPDYVAPNIPQLQTGIYSSDREFDFVVTNAFKEFRSEIRSELQARGYVPIHYVTAAGAPIVTIYARSESGNE